MESTKTGSDDCSSNYMKYIRAPRLPLKYQQSFDELCYQSYYDKHEIPYHHYQTDDNIDKNNHIVIRKIRNFSENTTAHGVRRIFIARNAYTARLWLFGILLCLIILVLQTYQLVMKFNRYEKITTIEVSVTVVSYGSKYLYFNLRLFYFF